MESTRMQLSFYCFVCSINTASAVYIYFIVLSRISKSAHLPLHIINHSSCQKDYFVGERGIKPVFRTY